MVVIDNESAMQGFSRDTLERQVWYIVQRDPKRDTWACTRDKGRNASHPVGNAHVLVCV